MRTFEFSDAKSHKFWNIDVQGNAFTVTYGKIGTAGQTQTKTFKDTATAQAEADKLIKEKAKKGYVEKTVKAIALEEKAFETALRENPEDFACWCAYADYLSEQGDPRGEFMQVQIALEDESRPKKERTALKKKEAELLKEYEREWLGGLAAYTINAKGPEDEYNPFSMTVAYRWRRGFVSEISVGRLSYALAHLLASDPVTRFVRELQVYGQFNGYYDENSPKQPRPRVKKPKGASRQYELFELIGSPLLENIRAFQMGGEVPDEDGWCDCHTGVPAIEQVIASMKRVEVLDLYCKDYKSADLFKLTNFMHLRELRIYHLGGREYRGQRYEYALDVLAKNPAFANLTHLLFHPHFAEESIDDDSDEAGRSYIPLEQVSALVRSPHLKKLTHLQLRLSDMGDDGVREIIASGILKQLKWLDLRHGCVTDDGAKLLAACPEAKLLERIDLSRNAVSSKGLAVLRKAGVNAVASKPQTADELERREYLCEGDSE